MVQRVNFLRFASDLARKIAGITGVITELQLARMGAFMRKFLPFRWACAVAVLVQRPIFSMLAEFCQFGHKTTQRDKGIDGGIDEVRSAQVGSFLHEFLAYR